MLHYVAGVAGGDVFGVVGRAGGSAIRGNGNPSMAGLSMGRRFFLRTARGAEGCLCMMHS
jgi:hypothetical protein